MHLMTEAALLVLGSAALSIALIWILWRDVWTPGLPARQAAEFAAEQNKLRLGESFLSREMLHPFLGYVLNPAADERTWNACDLQRPPINSFGLIHEQDALPRRSQDKVVVAVFGGSVAQYMAFDHRAALAEAMQASGSFDGRKVEIHCFAIGGFKQPQQLAELAYFLSLGAEFDVVINLDGFNEVALHPAENAFKGVCHSFPRAWASRTATRVDPGLVFLFGQLAFIQERRAGLWKSMQGGWNRFLPQNYLAMKAIESRLRSRKSRVIKSIRQFKPPLEGNLNTALGKEPGGARMLVDLWSRSSALMHDLSAAAGACYFHFLQPNQYVPDSKPLSDEELESAYDPNHPYRPGVLEGYPLLKLAGEALRARGIAFTDLTTLFQETRESVYSDRCCHFNRLGNERIAGAIAKAVVESKKLPCAATSRVE